MENYIVFTVGDDSKQNSILFEATEITLFKDLT